MEKVIEIRDLGKQYKLGSIGGTTLTEDIKSWWARRYGKCNSNAERIQHLPAYGKIFWALKDFNLDVYKGDTLGIIGLNGAGKSTLLKILSRVTAPTSGRIEMVGRVSSMLEVGTGFHGELTGRENIYLNGAILGMRRKEINAKIKDIIDFSECGEFIDTPVKRYSSGMYVKLAFAVAAHLDSEILIMDEVLAVGDIKFQEKCLGKMDDVSSKEGRTVLYVSHNMNTIRKLCNRCIVLEHGQKIYDGTSDNAIKLYSSSSLLIKKHYDLETEHVDGIKQIEFVSWDFVGENPCEYARTQLLRAKVVFKSFANCMNVHLRFMFRFLDDEPCGTFVSEPITILKDKQYAYEFNIPLNDFPDGEFYIRLTLAATNSYGTQKVLGRCIKAAYFSVAGNAGDYYNLDWVPFGWGAFLGRIKMDGGEL